MRVPVGDHAGSEAWLPQRAVVIVRWLVPSAFITRMTSPDRVTPLQRTLTVAANAILVPLGDQRGPVPLASTCCVPSRSWTTICALRSKTTVPLLPGNDACAGAAARPSTRAKSRAMSGRGKLDTVPPESGQGRDQLDKGALMRPENLPQRFLPELPTGDNARAPAQRVRRIVEVARERRQLQRAERVA